MCVKKKQSKPYVADGWGNRDHGGVARVSPITAAYRSPPAAGVVASAARRLRADSGVYLSIYLLPLRWWSHINYNIYSSVCDGHRLSEQRCM